MGTSNSVAHFNVCMAAHVRACIFHRPDLFSNTKKLAALKELPFPLSINPLGHTSPSIAYKLRLLFNYLDDFICGASDLSHAARQWGYFSAISTFLGLVFLPSKFEPPSQVQTILGIVYNSIQKIIALKKGKPQKIAKIVRDFANAAVWSAHDIQVVCGNLI